ncbi:UNVERIFIED_ORG: hypothetical protein E4P37_19275 [Bacillus sp. AZ43]
MSILGRLMGTAETAARGAARGGRGTGRPVRGMSARPVRRGGTMRGMGRGRATPATGGGIGRLVGGLLRGR